MKNSNGKTFPFPHDEIFNEWSYKLLSLITWKWNTFKAFEKVREKNKNVERERGTLNIMDKGKMKKNG